MFFNVLIFGQIMGIAPYIYNRISLVIKQINYNRFIKLVAIAIIKLEKKSINN